MSTSMGLKFTLAVMFGLGIVIIGRAPGEAYCVDDSWRDEVAQGTCTGLQSSKGWMFAVRRNCTGGRTCTDICKSMLGKDSQPTRMWCVDALYVFLGTHPLERELRTNEVEKLGAKVYRYFDCAKNHCGPNFCCCQGMTD